MITIKDATTKAAAFFTDVSGSRPGNMMVEEVERDLHGNWIITLGYDLSVGENNLSVLLGPRSAPRGYKVFKVNADSGEVFSMKIREVAAVEQGH